MTRLIAHSVTSKPGPDADVVELDFDERHRRRITMQTTSGREFLLDLPEARALADGDGLELSDGSTVRVKARAERVIDIGADGPAHLARVAWHLGNRHLPVQILGDAIRIRYDHVILDMLSGLGAETVTVDAPFHPEPGAYAQGHGHQHD